MEHWDLIEGCLIIIYFDLINLKMYRFEPKLLLTYFKFNFNQNAVPFWHFKVT